MQFPFMCIILKEKTLQKAIQTFAKYYVKILSSMEMPIG